MSLATDARCLEFRKAVPNTNRYAPEYGELWAATDLSEEVIPTLPPMVRVNSDPDDGMKQFVATVLAETEDVWKDVFHSHGAEYEEPKLVMHSGGLTTACDVVSAPTGLFYCANDFKIYLDVIQFQMLGQIGIYGDIGYAFLIAREVGHHVQNLLGVLAKSNQLRHQMNEIEANQMSIRVELQADCFAGVWGHYIKQKGILEAGDLEEALNAVHQLGDDTYQMRKLGYVMPEKFKNGTSKQRTTWFKRGFDTGSVSACDTFNNPL